MAELESISRTDIVLEFCKEVHQRGGAVKTKVNGKILPLDEISIKVGDAWWSADILQRVAHSLAFKHAAGELHQESDKFLVALLIRYNVI